LPHPQRTDYWTESSNPFRFRSTIQSRQISHILRESRDISKEDLPNLSAYSDIARLYLRAFWHDGCAVVVTVSIQASFPRTLSITGQDFHAIQ
jgi:hypothetical protein